MFLNSLRNDDASTLEVKLGIIIMDTREELLEKV